MTEMELVTGLKYLGIAYGKEFNQDECKIYYDFLNEYSYDTFRKSIKDLIKKTKFIPKINEIVEECEKNKERRKYDVLEIMRAKGYFKASEEYEKASRWLETGIIPEWFLEDMREYHKQEAIEAKEALLLE